MKRKIHHTTDLAECCQLCGRPFKMKWFDKEEKNGRSETMYEDKYCESCQVKRNGGLPLLSLADYNEMRRCNLCKEEYYELKGYKVL